MWNSPHSKTPRLEVRIAEYRKLSPLGGLLTVAWHLRGQFETPFEAGRPPMELGLEQGPWGCSKYLLPQWYMDWNRDMANPSGSTVGGTMAFILALSWRKPQRNPATDELVKL